MVFIETMSYMLNKIGKNDTIFRPINKEKFIGKEGYTVCRSSWELIFCRWCDHNSSVIGWMGEGISIPYIDRTSKDKKGLPKRRKYYPDFLCKIKDINGDVVVWLIEIKPSKETKPPLKRKNKTLKTKLYEEKTWAVNSSKWKSAESFCKRKGWIFKILTEKQLIR